MSEADLDLDEILAPVSTEEFFSGYWDERPLVLSRDGSANPYASLLSIADVERIVDSGVLKHPQIRLLKADRILPAESYSHPDTTLHLGALRAEQAAGATLVLPDLDRSWAPLSALCRRLERRFARHVWTNVYLTPPGSQAFAPHYDTHDVLILQIAGTKEWRIHGSPIVRPLRSQPWDPSLLASASGSAPALRLSPGDLLYLPRGQIHAATTVSAAPSLHVTVAVDAYTWADLLASAIARAAQSDDQLRRAIPVVAMEAIDGGAIDRLATGLARWLESVASSPVVRDAAEEATGTLLRSNLVETSVDPNRIDDRTLVRQRPRLQPRLEPRDDSVCLLYRGGQLNGPRRIEEALRYVAAAGEPFEVGAIPGDLTSSGRAVLARRLVQDGFLSVLLYGTTPERA